MKDLYDFSEAQRGPAVTTPGKTRITMMLDDDVLRAFRERAAREGKGYQTLINETLRVTLAGSDAPLTAETMRQMLREELKAVIHD